MHTDSNVVPLRTEEIAQLRSFHTALGVILNTLENRDMVKTYDPALCGHPIKPVPVAPIDIASAPLPASAIRQMVTQSMKKRMRVCPQCGSNKLDRKTNWQKADSDGLSVSCAYEDASEHRTLTRCLECRYSHSEIVSRADFDKESAELAAAAANELPLF